MEQDGIKIDIENRYIEQNINIYIKNRVTGPQIQNYAKNYAFHKKGERG